MGISKDRFGRFVRAAVVSGLLGAAGMTIVAQPVHAQSDPSDPSDPGTPSDPSDPSDPGGTTGGDTTTTGGGDTTTTGGGDTTGADVGADSSTLPITGGDGEMMLVLGAGASTAAVVLRRIARRA